MTKDPVTIGALILAGGQSSRMGQDKALIEIGDRPLLASTCDIALAVASPVRVVTPWPERYRAVVPASVEFVTEHREHFQGPVVGLLQGMQTLQTAWILALACDLPRLQADTLLSWGEGLTDLPPAVIAYLPRRGDRWEPLCGFYRVRARQSLAEFVAARGRSFQRWLAGENVRAIPQIQAEELFNLNTPADLQTIRQLR